MKLLKRQHYLRLSTAADAEDDSFSLLISTDLKGILRGWGPATRISPTWRLKPNVPNSVVDDRVTSQAAVHFVCGASPDWFASQLTPQALQLLGDDSIFLTLGAFSLIFVSYFEEVSDELTQLCTKFKLPYEIWFANEVSRGRNGEELFGDRMISENPAIYAPEADQSHMPTAILDNSKIQEDDTLGVMALELYALLSVIAKRSPPPYRSLADDCRQIERIANILITARVDDDPVVIAGTETLDLPEAEPQDLLLTLNAALSRHASQALSGTSPILRTECHFWPHSLLGTGVANLALRNLASFVTKLVTDSEYHEIYRLICDSPPPVVPKDSDKFSDTAHLRLNKDILGAFATHAGVAKEAGNKLAKVSAPIPITYFSGRDGFTNNALTVSAPLACVSGCASYQWNLGTITHELSHRIISGKLQVLLRRFINGLPGITMKDAIQDFFCVAPASTGDYAARLAGFTLFALHIEDYTDGKIQSIKNVPASDFFRSAKDRYSVLIEETLVHVFDYYHFYGHDPKLYIDFVWLSWAIQPSIIQKGDEYIKRTLTALAAPHVLSDNWMEIAFKEFQEALCHEPLAGSLSMQPQILDALSSRVSRVRYQHHLQQMQYILNLFHLVFKSDILLANAYDEKLPFPHFVYGKDPEGRRTKTKRNYGRVAGVFQGTRQRADPPGEFSNPFRFLREYSRRDQPSAAHSAWLLHMLAFNYVPAAPPGGAT
jgi:hypothetical protein